MAYSQRCIYALRATFELARKEGRGPITAAEVAEAQRIPLSFLENILGQLRQAGLIHSVRGKRGGYVLARPAALISMGTVIRSIEGPLNPVDCVGQTPDDNCPMRGDCVFLPVWQEALKAMTDVYDGTSFAQLIERHEGRGVAYVPDFAI